MTLDGWNRLGIYGLAIGVNLAVFGWVVLTFLQSPALFWIPTAMFGTVMVLLARWYADNDRFIGRAALVQAVIFTAWCAYLFISNWPGSL